MGSRKGYQFSDNTNSLRGILATIVGVLGLGGFVALVVRACQLKGEGAMLLGLLGILIGILVFVGLNIGIASFQEEDTIKGFKILGIFLNSVLLIGIVGTFLLGLFASL